MWGVEWLMITEGGEQDVPAVKFLVAIPKNVRDTLWAILDAVRTTGPDQWADPNSHTAMHGDLDFAHEVRDKQGQTLYRLFVVWKRDDRVVVVVDGRKKPNSTAIPDAEYKKIAALARTVHDDDYEIADATYFARLSFDTAAENEDLAAQVEALDAEKAELEQLLDQATSSDAS